jgi:hypothetical protein
MHFQRVVGVPEAEKGWVRKVHLAGPSFLQNSSFYFSRRLRDEAVVLREAWVILVVECNIVVNERLGVQRV